MKIKVELEVDDDFEKLYCYKCPFSYTEWYDDDGWVDYEERCIFYDDECPIEIIKE